MIRFISRHIAPGLVIAALSLGLGCGLMTNTDSPAPSSDAHSHEGHDHSHDHDDQGHSHLGPDGRQLIVLGEDEYHADLAVEPTDGTVTVILFDETGRSPLPIRQEQVILNFVASGGPRQLRLKALPQPNDPSGSSSRFVGQDSILADQPIVRGRLSLVIAGKPYTGPIAQLDRGQKVVR